MRESFAFLGSPPAAVRSQSSTHRARDLHQHRGRLRVERALGTGRRVRLLSWTRTESVSGRPGARNGRCGGEHPGCDDQHRRTGWVGLLRLPRAAPGGPSASPTSECREFVATSLDELQAALTTIPPYYAGAEGLPTEESGDLVLGGEAGRFERPVYLTTGMAASAAHGSSPTRSRSTAGGQWYSRSTGGTSLRADQRGVHRRDALELHVPRRAVLGNRGAAGLGNPAWSRGVLPGDFRTGWRAGGL